MEAKITFIIVTWNNQDVICDCLDSLYRHVNMKFNVMLVDNNSTDNTIEKVNAGNYMNCIIIKNHSNMGFAKANNLALKYVKTKYICYLNPDTIFIEDIIPKMIDFLENNPCTGIVGCKLLNEDLTLQPSTFNFSTPFNIFCEKFKISKVLPNIIKEYWFPYEAKSYKSKKVDWIIGAVMVLRCKDALEIKGFSEEYYMYTEDMDICMKMKRKLNKNTYYIADKSLVHLGGISEAQNTNYKKMELLLDNSIKFAEKFGNENSKRQTITMLSFCYFSRWLLLKVLVKLKILSYSKYANFIIKMETGWKYLKKYKE